MAVIGIIVKRLDTYNPVISASGDQTNFVAELIALMNFPFGDAHHLGGMDTVKLFRIILFLQQ